MYKQLQLLHSK